MQTIGTIIRTPLFLKDSLTAFITGKDPTQEMHEYAIKAIRVELKPVAGIIDEMVTLKRVGNSTQPYIFTEIKDYTGARCPDSVRFQMILNAHSGSILPPRPKLLVIDQLELVVGKGRLSLSDQRWATALDECVNRVGVPIALKETNAIAAHKYISEQWNNLIRVDRISFGANFGPLEDFSLYELARKIYNSIDRLDIGIILDYIYNLTLQNQFLSQIILEPLLIACLGLETYLGIYKNLMQDGTISGLLKNMMYMAGHIKYQFIPAVCWTTVCALPALLFTPAAPLLTIPFNFTWALASGLSTFVMTKGYGVFLWAITGLTQMIIDIGRDRGGAIIDGFSRGLADMFRKFLENLPNQEGANGNN